MIFNVECFPYMVGPAFGDQFRFSISRDGDVDDEIWLVVVPRDETGIAVVHRYRQNRWVRVTSSSVRAHAGTSDHISRIERTLRLRSQNLGH